MNKKITNLYLLVFLLPLLSFAQGWERTYDTGVNEIINAIDHTADGGLLLGGSLNGSPDDMNQAFLYKTDALGNVEWEYFDSTYISENIVVRDVAATFDGNYLYCFDSNNFLPGNNSTLQKIATNGSLLWEFDMSSTVYFENVQKIEKTLDGNYMIIGSNQNVDLNSVYGKIDENGNLLWEFQSLSPDDEITPYDITSTSNGEYLLLSNYVEDNSNDPKVYITRIGSDGPPVWSKILNNYGDLEIEIPQNIIELDNGNIIITGIHNDGIFNPDNPNNVLFVLTLDALGNQLSFEEYTDLNQNTIPRGLQSTSDGGFAIAGTSNIANLPSDLFLISFDSLGNELWQNNYGRSNTEDGYFLLAAPDQGFYLGGFTQNPDFSYDGYLVKTDSLGNSITNLLEGTVYNDENQNCTPESTEEGLNSWLVKATKGNTEFATLTDSLGNYIMDVDTGTYTITSYPISDYWNICNNGIVADFTSFNQTISQDLGAQALIDCPLLDVSIGTSLLRRCFDNSYYINYCNYGTTIAEDAYMEITLDPDMIYQSATAPLINQTDSLFTFDLGDIGIGECGNFQVNILLGDSTTCDSIPLGATHCVTAHIYPDSICPPPSNWTGASIEVNAICEGDSISFFIQNIGTAPTSTNLDFIIIEDDVVLLNGDYDDLAPNQIETIKVAADGSFFRLEAQQEPNHPGMNMPNVSVEGCGDSNAIFSWGFTNIYPQNDGNYFIDIDCRRNTGSFDPNDKTGFPLGREDENYIDPGQDLEYLIRFQNTGTDTAFTVVIRDTLSNLLDVTSVRPGASSHPYTFDISGGDILSFTFNNIMLPDSNVNLAGSNGFVKFRVDQQADLPLESEINNTAAIYFDFNQPVVTNTTLHTVGVPLITIVSVNQVPNSKNQVKVYPNPVGTIAHFELAGISITDGLFELYNVIGQPLRRQSFSGDAFDFERENLGRGVYFFRIENSGVLIGSGKLVVE